MNVSDSHHRRGFSIPKNPRIAFFLENTYENYRHLFYKHSSQNFPCISSNYHNYYYFKRLNSRVDSEKEPYILMMLIDQILYLFAPLGDIQDSFIVLLLYMDVYKYYRQSNCYMIREHVHMP